MSVISNVKIYGLDESIVASGYSMKTDADLHKPTEKDISRAVRLGNVPSGSGHDQFLTGIIAQFDLTFSNKAWVEAERYHWLDFVTSESTIHRITKFDLRKSCNEYVDDRVIAVVKEYVDKWNEEGNIDDKKELYLHILYNTPAGFRLTARMTTNYRQLKTTFAQRCEHLLPEWREFCREVADFPMFRELCLGVRET